MKKSTSSRIKEKKKHLKTLEELKSKHSIKKAKLTKETKRLELKYGKDHPRVKKIDTRIKQVKNGIKKLELEIRKLKYDIRKLGIPHPKTDLGSWIVYGIVVDKDLKSEEGLTVGLYDKDPMASEPLGYAETDPTGYFNIRCEKKIIKRLFNAKSELYLKVLDRKGELLDITKHTTFLKSGKIKFFEIRLKKKKKNK